MNQSALFKTLRRLCGNLNPNEVANVDLNEYLVSALSWLSDELQYHVKTDTLEPLLVTGQQEYQLPSDFMYAVFVEWNGNRLTPADIYTWDRQNSDWRAATSSEPSEFAIEGRKLLMNPPASSGSVSTDNTLTIRYIAEAPDVTPSGTPGLSDSDQRIALYMAAWEWLMNHPTDENSVRAQSWKAILEQRLPQAKRRAAGPILDHQQGFQPAVRRFGGRR